MTKRVARSDQRRVRVRRRLLVERLGDRRVLAAITGAVFDDANHSFQRDSGELAAANRLVFIDDNSNGSLDNGERYALADSNGEFEFGDLADGTYQLRLFNGTLSQIQTVPIEATKESPTVSVIDAKQLVLPGQMPIAMTENSVVIGDLDAGTSNIISVGDQLVKSQTLPGGKLLVLGIDAGDATVWKIDPSTQAISEVPLSDSSVAWSDLAVDGEGRGVIFEATTTGVSEQEVLGIRSLDASSETSITVSEILQTIPIDAQVIASDAGNRSVFAWAANDGLQFSLWSNVTSSFITSSTVADASNTELLAFDDASGILAIRTPSGGVRVHDADANFAPLHILPDVTGPIAIDGARDLLVTVSPTEAMLKLINLRDGALIADLAVDLSSIGQVSSLAFGDNNDAITVLGAAGMTEIALRRSGARKVTISDNDDADPVLFGISTSGENTAPSYTFAPSFTTNEDEWFALPAPAALENASDPNNDLFVLLQRSEAANGVAIIGTDGSIAYSPQDNFNGTETIQIQLHDGRDVSEFISLNIDVLPVADPPTDIMIEMAPVAENIVQGRAVGTIKIVDADGSGNHIVTINDPRFIFQDGQIVFIGEESLDSESEPQIAIGVTVTDIETDTVIHEAFGVTVNPRNEPIDAISPTTASVHENKPGGYVVANIEVEDPDVDDVHTLTVDDSRFVIENSQLLTAENAVIDYEESPVITINVTAVDLAGNSLTQPIEITVVDVAEQPNSIDLSNRTVMEFVPGDTVGDVSLDGQTSTDRFTFTVNDPRFEIDGTQLKLLNDQMVERANQEEIELQISADDRLNEFAGVTGTFVIQVLENSEPHHNHDNPYDVNHNGEVTALDALAIINYLNTYGPGPVGPHGRGLCYDVNADRWVTALDALLILNEMKRNPLGTVGNGENTNGEGEQVAGPQGSDATLPNHDLGEKSELDAQDIADPSLVSESSNFTPHAGSSQTDQFSPHENESLELLPHESRERFAENVDATLRLLSDDES